MFLIRKIYVNALTITDIAMKLLFSIALLFLLSSVASNKLSRKIAIFPPEYWVDSTPNNVWICSEENVTLSASLNNGLNRVADLERGILAGKITRIALPPFDQLRIVDDDRRKVYRLTIRIKSRSESLVEDFYIERRPEIRWIEIYTDKPIYRQKETVKVKIVTLKANFRISSSPLLVGIKDADSLTVFKNVFNDTGRFGLVEFSFILPRHSSCGTWLIEAMDFGSNLLIINRTFSVAVHDLPNLQAVIVPSKTYFTNLNESVDLMISVRSNYGFDVTGKAYVICYFEKGAERRFLVQIQNGKGSLCLRLNECISDSSRTINILSTEKLFVNVEYTDLDTGEQSYQSVVLVKRKLFDVALDAHILKFGLGGADILPVLIKLRNLGSHSDDAHFYDLKTSVNCLKYRMERIKFLKEYKAKISSQNPSIVFHVNIPHQEFCFALHLKIDLSCNENSQHTTEYLVPLIFPRESSYLNFSKFEYEVTDDIKAHLIEKHSGIRNSYYLVYCMNGFTLMGKINQTKRFNLKANVSMIPECLLMLYNLSDNGLLIVNDVLKFFVKSKCNADDDFHKSIQITSYCVCMLFAPFHIKIRMKLFQTDLTIVGPLRDLYDSFIQKKLSNFKNFDVVLNDTVSVPSCQNDRNCYKARNDPLITSESEFPGLEVISESRKVVDSADSEILRRHFFPESWIFEAFLLRDNQSLIVLEKTIPHSITDWIFRVRTFSGQYGVCEKILSIKTSQNIYFHMDLPTNVFVGQQILAKVVIVNSSPKNEHVSLEIKHPQDICSAKPLFDVHETSIRARNSTFLIVPFEFLNEGRFDIEMTLKSRNDANFIFDRYIKSVDVTFDSNLWEQKNLYFMIDTDNYAKYDLPNLNDSVFEISFLRNNRIGQTINLVLIDLKKEKDLHVQRVKFQMSVSPNVLKFDDSGMIEQENRFLSKLVKRELWPKVEKVDQLSNLLRLISVVVKIVDTCEADASRSGQLLIESRQLLNYAMLDMLSFRNRDGSFRGRRDPKSRADSWLSLISTLLQCRMDQDFTTIKASLDFLLDSYEKAKFEFNEITFLFKNSDEISLFSNVFLKMAVVCMEYAKKDFDINVRLNFNVNMIKTRLYSIDVKSVDNLIISSMAYSLSDSNSSFSMKLLGSLFNDSAKNNGRFKKFYYKPRSSSAFEKLKHTARRWLPWFTTSYRKRLSANELLTNSFALSTILKMKEAKSAFLDRNVYVPDILAYIRMHQQADEGFNDFLDTFFGLEAVQLYDRKKYRVDEQIMPKLFIDFECENTCNIPKVTLDRFTPTQIRFIDFRNTNRVNLSLTGQGSASINMFYNTKSTPTASLIESTSLPVQFDSKIRENGTVDHEICFEITDSVVTSFTIEHTLQRHLNYVPHSIDFMTRNATVVSHESTSYGLNVFAENLDTNVRYCYIFKTKYNNALVSFSHSLIPMVIARHHLFVTCPNPSVHNDQCDIFCRDRQDRTLIKYACNRDYYSAIVRIEEIFANINIHGSLYENASVSVMGLLFASVREMNYSLKFTLLKKAFCACPKFEIDRVYVLIVPKDYISRQMYGPNDEKRSLLIVLDVNTIMEAVFDTTCDDIRQMNVLRLLEDRNRSVLCQSF